MGLLDTLVGALSGQPDSATAPPAGGSLQAALAALLAENGGLPGLMRKFSQSGLGDIFSSWTGTGENQPVSPAQVDRTLGSDRLQALAAQLGVDPSQASGFLSEYLPKIVDQLTPDGRIDPDADPQQGLAALLPSLLASFGDNPRRQA